MKKNIIKAVIAVVFVVGAVVGFNTNAKAIVKPRYCGCNPECNGFVLALMSHCE